LARALRFFGAAQRDHRNDDGRDEQRHSEHDQQYPHRTPFRPAWAEVDQRCGKM
jgi:hypothetical protein